MARRSSAQSFRDAWVEISSYLANDPELKASVCDHINEISYVDRTTAELWAEAASYEGFDVKKFLKVLSRKHREFEATEPQRVVITVTLSSGGEDKSFIFSNREEMMRDVCFLIMVFLQRGSNWDKMTTKTNADMVKILNLLKDKYDIDTNIREARKAIPAEVVTIPRIAACFPLRTLQFLAMGTGRVIVDISQITNVPGIPLWMQHNACASAFPTYSSLPPIRAATLFAFGVHVLTDDVLHKKDGRYTSLADIFKYFSNAHNTVAVPRNARVKFLEATGFVQVVEESVYEVTLQFPVLDSESLINKILALRPDDSTAAEVRGQMTRLVERTGSTIR